MPCIRSEPTDGALAILDAALRRGVMDAFNAVLGCGRDQAARGKIFRRGRELRGTASRATAGKKEDDRGPTIARLPVWRKIEVDSQITLRRGLIHRHRFVVDRMDIRLDRPQCR